MTTIAAAGAQGITTYGAGVALAIPTGATEAIVGTGSTLSLAGLLTLDAERTTDTTTTSDGEAIGLNVGTGASLALTVADETARVSVARAIATTADADLTAAIHGTSLSTALASAQGALDGSLPAKSIIDAWIAKGQANGWLPNPFPLPDIVTPDGSVGIAAAIAVNVGLPNAEARQFTGSTLTVGGDLSLEATNLYGSQALPDSTPVTTA